MPQVPFAFQCSVQENELLPLKSSINGRLQSVFASNSPEFEYYLQIYPNGDRESRRGETWIFLCLKFKNVKKVDTDFTIAIESANYSKTDNYVYEKPMGWGRRICKTDELYDQGMKYIIDEKFTVKVHGIFKYDTENFIHAAIAEQKWEGGKLGDQLWKKDATKDFTIITDDGKEIEVHKFVLANQSEVLNTTFDLSNIKIPRKKGEITDFSSKVVETGIKIIYNCNFEFSLSISELMSLLQFLDKYGLPDLKDDVEPLLIAQISPSNVVPLANCSVKTNSSKLKEKCMEFLMDSFASKTPLHEIKTLDKYIATQILQSFLAPSVESTDALTIVEERQKWIGGELGDEFWKNDETKDLTIILEDGKELKVHKSVIGIRSKIFYAISTSKTEDDSNDNKAEIIGFPYDVVETGIKMIYDCNSTTSLSTEKLISLQHFHDKFNLPNLKAKVEPLLIAQISPSTACRLMNGSILTNSIKLREKCLEFLMDSFASKIPLADIDILDKDIALKILEDSLYHIVQVRQ